MRIHRADPKARIAAEILEQIRQGVRYASLDDDVLTLRDDYGQRFIYRIGDYDPATRTYEMEWPD
jgi:hypothetical protein